jgi:hypothetical protein
VAHRVERHHRPTGVTTAPVCYGLVLEGAPVWGRLEELIGVASGQTDWPRVTMECVAPGPGDPQKAYFDDRRADLPCLFGGWLSAERESMTATFAREPEPGAELLAHPGLAGVGVLFARWLGRAAFHGGLVLGAEGAFGVLGAKGAGKTTTLAMLAQAGYTVLSDDLTVVADGMAFGGPRVLDLRADAASRVHAELRTVSVRGRHRRRMTLPAGPIQVPICGWIYLQVGREVTAHPVPPADRLARLGQHLAHSLVTPSAVDFLSLGTLPAWSVSRPLAWDVVPKLVEVIGGLIGASR